MADKLELVIGNTVIASRDIPKRESFETFTFTLTEEERARWPVDTEAKFQFVLDEGVADYWFDGVALHIVGKDGHERTIAWLELELPGRVYDAPATGV